MKGARKYAQLFETGQYGKFYLVSGNHARGLTFHIQILPEGKEALPNGSNNLCRNNDAVEVYGVIGGNPGWTEYYGWKHRGPWMQDFGNLVKEAEATKENEKVKTAKITEQEAVNEERRIRTLLAAY